MLNFKHCVKCNYCQILRNFILVIILVQIFNMLEYSADVFLVILMSNLNISVIVFIQVFSLHEVVGLQD